MHSLKTMTLAALIVVTPLCLLEVSFAHQGPDEWEEPLNAYQPPDKVMDAIGIEPGMVVGEIGAGRGRYTVHLAARVGEAGKVYANDVNEHKLAYIKHRCKRDGIENVVTIVGKVADPRLPYSRLDVVFMIDTYYQLNEPVELMKKAVASLRPNGFLAIVEAEPEKLGKGWSKDSTPKELLIKQAERAGYNLIRVETFLKRDNIYILRPVAYKRPDEPPLSGLR
jgi:ubiquinone/menaquinone biosynthesis C-methylase UbiE